MTKFQFWLLIKICLYFMINARINLCVQAAAQNPQSQWWQQGSCNKDYIRSKYFRACKSSKRSSTYYARHIQMINSYFDSPNQYENSEETAYDRDVKMILGLSPTHNNGHSSNYKYNNKYNNPGPPQAHPSLTTKTKNNNYNNYYRKKRQHEQYADADNFFYYKTLSSVENKNNNRKIRDAAETLLTKCCGGYGCEDSDFQDFCNSY